MEKLYRSETVLLQRTRLMTDADAHLVGAEYVQKVIQREIQILSDVNYFTSVRVPRHGTTHRSTSPSVNDNTASTSSNSNTQQTNGWQKPVDSPLLTDSVLTSVYFVDTDDGNSSDDLASVDMTKHNDADLLDLFGHQ